MPQHRVPCCENREAAIIAAPRVVRLEVRVDPAGFVDAVAPMLYRLLSPHV